MRNDLVDNCVDYFMNGLARFSTDVELRKLLRGDVNRVLNNDYAPRALVTDVCMARHGYAKLRGRVTELDQYRLLHGLKFSIAMLERLDIFGKND